VNCRRNPSTGRRRQPAKNNLGLHSRRYLGRREAAATARRREAATATRREAAATARRMVEEERAAVGLAAVVMAKWSRSRCEGRDPGQALARAPERR